MFFSFLVTRYYQFGESSVESPRLFQCAQGDIDRSQYGARLQLLPENVKNIIEVVNFADIGLTSVNCNLQLLRAGEDGRDDFVALPTFTVHSIEPLDDNKTSSLSFNHPELFSAKGQKSKRVGLFELNEIAPEVTRFLVSSIEELDLAKFYSIFVFNVDVWIKYESLRGFYEQIMDPAICEVVDFSCFDEFSNWQL